MVTVKCCKECNKKFKKDEDLFSAWIHFGPAGVSKEGKRLWDQKFHRTYKKDYGVRRIIRKSFRVVNVITPAGIYLGKRLTISIDSKRREIVLKKIVRGLFWVEYKERLPENVSVEIYGLAKNDKWINEFIHVTEPATQYWEGIFEYRHRRLESNTFRSLWLMSFYRENYFLAFVDDIDDFLLK